MKILLTVPEAAERLQISRSLLYRLIAGRQISIVKIGRSTRIPVAELEEFVTRNSARIDGGHHGQ